MKIEIKYKDQTLNWCVMTLVDGQDQVKEFVEEADRDESMIISFVEMTEEEFLELPDFTGF